jgi:hypothetical protein
MSNGQITNGQRSAHTLTASTPTRSHRHAHPEQFATAHASPIPRALFRSPGFLERQAVMADPAVPEWVPDFPPVRSARIIFAKAQDAARAWEQPVTPGELLTISKDLGSALANTGAALSRLSVYHAPYQAPADKRFRLYDHPDEPNIFIECAARALDCAGSDLALALSDHITRSGHPDSPALSAGTRLAEATRTAYVIIERPSGSAAGRDVAVSAFMAAAGALDAAVENLAAHASAPMPAILARQRVRLEQAHIALRESLAASAAGKDVSGGPAAAQSIRERHPILSHRSRPAPDAAGRAATTLATAAFPQPAPGPADAATHQAAQASPARFRLRARRPGTYGALL